MFIAQNTVTLLGILALRLFWDGTRRPHPSCVVVLHKHAWSRFERGRKSKGRVGLSPASQHKDCLNWLAPRLVLSERPPPSSTSLPTTKPSIATPSSPPSPQMRGGGALIILPSHLLADPQDACTTPQTSLTRTPDTTGSLTLDTRTHSGCRAHCQRICAHRLPYTSLACMQDTPGCLTLHPRRTCADTHAHMYTLNAHADTHTHTYALNAHCNFGGRTPLPRCPCRCWTTSSSSRHKQLCFDN
jgi:hypothetical protein